MKLRRRNFLKGIAGVAALSTISRSAVSRPLEFNKNILSVVLGPSFDGTSEFSVVHEQPENVRYLVYQGGRFISEARVTTITSEFTSAKIDKFLIRNLPMDEKLTLHIWNNKRKIDERNFKNISSQKSHYKIGLVSCMRAEDHDKAMWDSLATQYCDLLLFLGDNVYIDFFRNTNANPRLLWEKYVETRMILNFYQWKNLVPTIAIWDDHDFGGDNTGRDFKFVPETQQNFKNFWAQNLDENGFLSKGPGISGRFTLANQTFLMLDGRSFRDKPDSGKPYSLFGKEQEDWIFETIYQAPGLTWLCNGTQWFNPSGGESFCKDHKVNYIRFVEKLNRLNKHTIYVSGDVHYSEICESPSLLKNKTVELTSSSMHSANFFALPTFGKGAVRLKSAWQLNYLVCSIGTNNSSSFIKTECYTRGKQKLFDHAIAFEHQSLK